MSKKKVSKTVIAACRNRRGKIIMGADHASSYDWGQREFMERAKIKKKGGLIIGATGDGGLCTLFVDIMDRPHIDVTDPDIYMFHHFKNQVYKTLKQQKNVDQHGFIRFAGPANVGLLVAVLGQVYTVNITTSEEDVGGNGHLFGDIHIDTVPLPNAIGCGALPAITSLLKDLRQDGYNTKDHMDQAVRLSCELSPGCGLRPGAKPDILIED